MPESFLYVTILPGQTPPTVPLIVGRTWIEVSQLEWVDIGWHVVLKRKPMRTIVVDVEEELR